jgi:Ca2+-binding RTX toxin-like protein
VTRRRATRGLLPTILVLFALAGGGPVSAAPPDPVDDGNGKEFRQLYETTGVSWNQVAAICPRDGRTPCSGSIGTKVFSGWIWATDAQVIALMGAFDPAMLTGDPPTVAGPEHVFTAVAFLGQMRWTIDITSTYSHSEAAIGWTSSTDTSGAPIGAAVAFGFPPASGSFAVGTGGTATETSSTRGVWLWSPSASDHTPPVISPIIQGTHGTNGWYVSNVSVDWAVSDTESSITERVGCLPATVSADTAGTSFSCQATSDGGTAVQSASVKRDATAPTVTCGSTAPVFDIYQLGAQVPAAVTDAGSGPVTASTYGIANTSRTGSFTVTVSGRDRAGNVTSRACPYSVVLPSCHGLTPTRVGTAANDVITGTTGRDIIVALGGADTINGSGGADVICGGDGPDTINGQSGYDWIAGGASSDDIYGGGGDDYLDGGLHNDSLRGDDGQDTCTSGEIRMSSCEEIR